MSRSFEGSQAEAFVAAPRVVKPKRKYKQPEQQQDEELRVAYNNMMWQKRVVRGNTYAAMVTSKNVELPQKNTFKPRPQRQDDSALQALSHLGRRVNIQIFTDEFVERLTDKPPCYQVEVQTDFNITKPIVRLYMKQKTGVDQDTQIWDNDLFDFDYQVEPLLQILCGKTLEISRTQVLQQQQLRIMKQKQKYYINENNKQANKISKMEQHQRQLKQQNDRKIALLKQRKEVQKQTHKKLMARTLGKRLLRDIKTNTTQILDSHGLFRNPLESQLAQQLLPNFLNQTADKLKKDTIVLGQLESLFKQIELDILHEHRLSLETEKTRRELIVKNRQQKARQKQERKRMRMQELRMIKFLQDEKIWIQKMQNQGQQEAEQNKNEDNADKKNAGDNKSEKAQED